MCVNRKPVSAAREYRRWVFSVGRNTVAETARVRRVKDAYNSQVHWSLWEPRREVASWNSMSYSVTVREYGETGEAAPLLTRTHT